MGFDSFWHWIILLVVVLLIFGTKKIRNLGPDLGNAVRGFKKAMHSDGDDEAGQAKDASEKLQADPPPTAQASTQGQRDTSESK